MSGISFKWITVPWSNRTKEQQAVQLWEVRWQSRHGEFSGDIRPEMECFTNERDAKDFAEALENAFKLIKTTSGDKVRLSRAK